jgi:5-oxopent-3-ene-1,2,5-tricarboxylate decarboxylase / 2-hydroxyhepta-2,4-diene-1,7-dioate isomerase
MTKTALGTVYGVILNDPYSVQALGSLDDAPYKGAPKAPVLYIKPANTHASEGACVVLPTGTNAVEVAATVGLVVGRAACRLPEAQAMEAVSGLVLAADLSLPHDSYYRPAIREKIFDGALPMSGVLALTDLAGLCLETRINGETVDRHRVDEWIRSPARLLWPELRRPRQGTGVQGTGSAAGLPEGAEHHRRPSGADPSSGRRHLHALRVRTGRGHRQDRLEPQQRPRRWTWLPATPWPTTTPSATISRTITGRTCASRTATTARRSAPGWSMLPMCRIRWH